MIRRLLCLTICLALAQPPARAIEVAGTTEPEPAVFQIRDRTTEPLLRADKPWEAHSVGYCSVIREGGRWRMWYGAYDRNYKRDDDCYLCYAESPDGIRWTKPDLGLVEYHRSRRNNILLAGPQIGGFSFSYVFLDESKPAGEKYKMIWNRFDPTKQEWWVYGATSSDGIRWSRLPKPLSAKNSDTQTVCIPDGGRYRLYSRLWDQGTFRGNRTVGYSESDHFGDFPTPTEILRHNAQDPAGMQFYTSAATKLRDHFYLMFPAAFYTKNQMVRPHLASSRDGVHFARHGREPVIDVGKGFDRMGVYVAAGATPGDAPNTWWFYYFGTKLEHDIKPEAVKYEGGIGRFLLVLQ